MSFTALLFLISGGMAGTFLRYILTKILANIKIFSSFNMPISVLFINIRDDIEIDIDELFHISDIRSVINLNQKFYVLANKCDNLLGYHLIEIDEN